MLRFRLLSAAIIICSALVFVFLDATYSPFGCRGFWMLPVGIYLFFGSAIECVTMVRSGSLAGVACGDIRWPALLGCAGIIAASSVVVLWPLSGEAYPRDCLLGPLGWPLAAILIALFACFAWYLPRYQAGSGDFLRALLAGWVSGYFGGCFAFAIALRMVGESRWGLFLLVGIIVVTKFADAGAYFMGRAFGRTRLCPQISPGKTLEGLLGGVFVAMLAAWIYFGWWGRLVFGTAISAPWVGVASVGVSLAMAGLIGDLLVSVFKREMGCKDSGRLLPGLGGLWDVTDSLLPAFVVGYLLVMAGLVGGPGQ